MDPSETSTQASSQTPQPHRGGVAAFSPIREYWDRWGPVTTMVLAVLGALLGATYYLSRKVATIETVEIAVKELKDDFARTSQEVNQMGKIVAQSSAKAERLDSLQTDYQNLRNQQSADTQRASTDIRDLVVRITRLEVSLKLNNMISSGKFEGAFLRTPAGEKFYGPADVEKFRKDADKVIGGGGGFRVEELQYRPEKNACVPSPRPDCIKLVFFDTNRGEDYSYTIQARVFSQQRLARLGNGINAESQAFLPCDFHAI